MDSQTDAKIREILADMISKYSTVIPKNTIFKIFYYPDMNFFGVGNSSLDVCSDETIKCKYNYYIRQSVSFMLSKNDGTHTIVINDKVKYNADTNKFKVPLGLSVGKNFFKMADAEITYEEARFALAHELAHVKNNDVNHFREWATYVIIPDLLFYSPICLSAVKRNFRFMGLMTFLPVYHGIHSYLNRKKEYRADADAIKFMGGDIEKNKENAVSFFMNSTITTKNIDMDKAKKYVLNAGTFKIITLFSQAFTGIVFPSHPSIEKRIKAIKDIKE